jgi:hypothetical protein
MPAKLEYSEGAAVQTVLSTSVTRANEQAQDGTTRGMHTLA